MAIENALIAKICGGLVAVGGSGGIAYAQKDNISKWFNETFSKESKTYLYVVASSVVEAGTTDPTGSEDLYKGETGSKTKNYKCKLETKEYQCDIVKKISKNANKKWINVKDTFNKGVDIDSAITKSSLQTGNELFLLRITPQTTTPVVDWKEPKTIDILLNTDTDGTKKFGQVKTIFGKLNDDFLGKVNLFLTKVKNLGDSSPPAHFSKATGKTYKCAFSSAETLTKECTIHKFTTDTQTVSTDSGYSNLIFSGKSTNEITASDQIKQNEYYLVKFTGDLNKADYSSEDLIYYEEVSANNTVTNKKVIEFSPKIVSFLFQPTPESTEENILLIDQK